jgi:hypothetical protein
MNKMYFETTVRHRKTSGEGVQKVVNENYLVEGYSFTEAESNINREIVAYISEEFRVTNIKLTNYSEIILAEDGDRWFKAKVTLVSYNEETGKEGKSNIYLLVQANDAKNAYENTAEAMRTTMGEYSIPAVSEVNLVDVFLPIRE